MSKCGTDFSLSRLMDRLKFAGGEACRNTLFCFYYV